MDDVCKECGRTISIKRIVKTKPGWEEFEQTCDLTPSTAFPNPKCLKETKDE